MYWCFAIPDKTGILCKWEIFLVHNILHIWNYQSGKDSYVFFSNEKLPFGIKRQTKKNSFYMVSISMPTWQNSTWIIL